jgi:hypothetical protein
MGARDRAPVFVERFAGTSGPAIRQHGRVHRAGRGSGNAGNLKPWLFKQPVENAPRERAVRASALERQIDQHGASVRRGVRLA